MIERLVPNGTTACTMTASRVPSQVDSNCHLNVDEFAESANTADYIETRNVARVFEVKLPVLTGTGEIDRINMGVAFHGMDLAGAEFDVRFNGVAVTTAKRFDLDTDGDDDTIAVTWSPSEFLSPVNVETWNGLAATGLVTMKMVSINGTGHGPGDEYIPDGT